MMLLHLVLGAGVLLGASGQSVKDDLVTLGERWKKACYDKEGNKYKKNEKVTGTCIQYTCMFKKKKYSWKAKDTKSCCKVGGDMFPLYNTVYTEEYGPSTSLNYTCGEGLKVRPVMVQRGCSIFGQNVNPGETLLWAEKCSSVSCYMDENNFPTIDYHSWYQGTGCCEYEGYLLSDGEYTWTNSGFEIQCCKGMLNYVLPYVPGEEPQFPGGYPGSGSYTGSGSGWGSEWGSETGVGGNTGGGVGPLPGVLPGAGNDSCTCGQRVKATRIVNGEETEVNEFPWQVGLLDAGWGYSTWCGGTLISDQWVLTAAHCTVGMAASELEVLVGEHDYSTDTETQSLRMKVSDIINHWDYDSSTTNKDFALLKLEYPIDFHAYPHIRPACLPQDDENDYAGYSSIVSGWGTTTMGGSLSSYLQYVSVNVLSNDACVNSYGYGEGSITDQMVCANVEGGGKDSCQGDSGGPLVTPNPDLYEVIGVVSWGVGCALADYPGVYARVSRQLEWIGANTEGSWNTCGRNM